MFDCEAWAGTLATHIPGRSENQHPLHAGEEGKGALGRECKVSSWVTLGHPHLTWLRMSQALLCGPIERWIMSITTSSEVNSPLSVPSQPGNHTRKGPHTSVLLPSKLSLFVEACLALEPGALYSPVY